MCEPASRACDQSAAWHQMPVSAQAGLKTWHENEKARLLSSLHIHWAHPTVHRTYHVFGTKFATSWVCSHFLHWCTAACWSEIMQHTAHTLTEFTGRSIALAYYLDMGFTIFPRTCWWVICDDQVCESICHKNLFLILLATTLHLIGIDPAFVQVLNASVWLLTLPKHTSPHSEHCKSF